MDHERLVREVERERDVPELLPRAHELLGLAQHLVEVDRRPRRLGRVGVREHLAHDPRRAVEALSCTAATLPGGRLHVAAGERVAGQGEVVGHALERVVDLVGDAGGEAAHGREPLGVEELPLELAHARAPRAARASSTARRRACCSAKPPSSRPSAITARFSA